MLLADLPAHLFRALLASLRAQVYVAGAAAVAAAACLGLALGAGHTALVVGVWMLLGAALVTVAASVAASGRVPEGGALVDLASRGIVQALCIAAPAAMIVALTGAAASVHPLLGLLLVPIAFVACALLAGPAALVPGAIAAGDRAWLPRRALTVARSMPWRLAGVVLVGTVLVALLALPAVLGGLLLTAVLGPLGFVGYGLGAAVATPIVGAASGELWARRGGADEVEAGVGAPAVTSGVDAAPTWLAGPSWHATFDAQGMWGTWLQMPSAGPVAVRAAVPDGMAMRVLVHGPDGAWAECGMLAATGTPPLVVALDAGASWLQLQASGVVPGLVLDVTLLVPAVAAASAA